MSAANMESTAQMAQIMASFVKMLQALLAPEEIRGNERLEAMKKCSDLLMSGDPGCYKLFSNEDAKEMEKLLIKEGIPFIPVASGNNNTVMVVPKKYEEQYLEIQEAFRYTDLKAYKEVDEMNMLDSLRPVYDKVPVLHYDTQEMATLAAEKLYASGMSCSVGKNLDGSFDIIVQPMVMYKNGPAPDFTMFELLMAYEQSKNSPILGVGDEWQKARLEQAKYDEGRMEDFAKRALKGENVVLSDLSPNRMATIYIEAKNGEIFINKMDETSGEWDSITCKKCENLTPDDIKKMCSRFTEEIHDMGCIPATEFEVQYKGKVPGYDHRTPDNIRPSYSNKGVNLEEIGRVEVKDLLTKLQREAGRQVQAEFKRTGKTVDRTNMGSIDAALKMQKEYIIKELKNPNNKHIAEFITKGGGLSGVQRQAWLVDIAKQFEGSGRQTPFNTHYQEMPIKQLDKAAKTRAAARVAEWQMEMDAETTKE